MNSTELALNERIKELTCLYDISTIIVNSDVETLEDTIKAIAFSLKKAFRFAEGFFVFLLFRIEQYHLVYKGIVLHHGKGIGMDAVMDFTLGNVFLNPFTQNRGKQYVPNHFLLND